MSLHNGSSHKFNEVEPPTNLDRFSFDSKFEQIAADAARFQTTSITVRKYLDWYGEQPVTVVNKRGMKSMPAHEAEIRWQVLGEKFRILRQMELVLPVSNHYAYEQRGW